MADVTVVVLPAVVGWQVVATMGPRSMRWGPYQALADAEAVRDRLARRLIEHERPRHSSDGE